MASVLDIITEHKHGSEPLGLVKSHGERAIPELFEILKGWQLTQACCRALEEYPLAVKQRLVHPEAVKLVGEYLCQQETYGPKSISFGYVLERMLPMLVRETRETPALPELLCKALEGKAKKIVHTHRFEVFATYVRHPATHAILRDLEKPRDYAWA